MSIKPILFNTDEVRATLDGRKTTKRMVVKGAKSEWCYEGLSDDAAVVAVDRNGMEYAKSVDGLWATFEDDDGPIDFPMVKSPYLPGDILYVRETWAPLYANDSRAEVVGYMYRADPDCQTMADYDRKYPAGKEWTWEGRWRPSIHIPKAATRIWLRVTDVRVERLQEINMFGIWNEGVVPVGVKGGHWHQWQNDYMKPAWDSTIKPTDRERYGWAANPWVWVIAFGRCENPDNE